MSQDKPKTLAEIMAENQRIRTAAPEPVTINRAKPSRAESLARLMSRVSSFTPINPVDEPPIAEEPAIECPKCGGIGQVSSGAKPGEPLFGKLIPCPNPDCGVVRRNQEKRFVNQQEQFLRQFGQTVEYYDYASMGHYKDSDKRLPLRCARTWLKDGLIVDTDRDIAKTSLVFCGKVGTGKTYLMSAMHNALRERGIFAPFLKIRTMLKGVQRGYSEDAELRDYQAENLLRVAPFLFIDELETGLHSADRTDIFESIIDYRCLHALPTIIATNLEQDEVADAWNHRIQSRLVHMAWWVSLSGATRRDTSPEMK